MGIEIKCKECSQVLFEFDGIPNDVIWYSMLRDELDGECPKFCHKLPSVSSYANKMQLEVKAVMPVLVK